MQSFPVTTPASASVYANVAAERTTPLLSVAQLEVQTAIAEAQARAKADPLLNGQAARKAVRT